VRPRRFEGEAGIPDDPGVRTFLPMRKSMRDYSGASRRIDSAWIAAERDGRSGRRRALLVRGGGLSPAEEPTLRLVRLKQGKLIALAKACAWMNPPDVIYRAAGERHKMAAGVRWAEKKPRSQLVRRRTVR